MSTRYVWGRYEFSVEQKFRTNAATSIWGDDLTIYDSITGLPLNLKTGDTLYYAVFAGYTRDSEGIQVADFVSTETVVIGSASSVGDTITIDYGQAAVFSGSPISHSIVSVESAVCAIWEDDVAEFRIGYSNSSQLYLNIRGCGYWWFENEKGSFVSDVSGTSQGPYPPCPAAPPALW